MNKEAGIKRTADIYNMIPNLFWTALLLIPVTVFCYSLMPSKLFWIFFTVSILAIFLPQSFFYNIQVGKTATFYKRMGVGFINRFTQNGDIVNKLLRKRYPGYQVVSKKQLSVQKLISQTYVFEKFHFILFLFFIMIMVYSVVNGFFVWAAVFIISNIVYNVYPAFLQQYIRIRLKKAAQRMLPAN